jgi:hypothetical protein
MQCTAGKKQSELQSDFPKKIANQQRRGSLVSGQSEPLYTATEVALAALPMA